MAGYRAIGAALDGWNSGMSIRKRRYPVVYSTVGQSILRLPQQKHGYTVYFEFYTTGGRVVAY
jgi:hypothetical protein